MIGFLDTKIFEFRDNNELVDTLTTYGEDLMCDVLLLVDKMDNIVGIIENGKWKSMARICEDVKYYLYGVHNSNLLGDIGNGDKLPICTSWQLGPESFFYSTIRYPQHISF